MEIFITMKKIFFLLALIFVIGLIFFFFNSKIQKEVFNQGELIIDDRIKTVVEIADNPQTRAIGLSGRDFLASDAGMLFVLDQEEIPSFWMKGMKFPLDIIWLNSGKIIALSENVPIPIVNNFPLYSPNNLVDQVLEVNAGFVNFNNIQIGDKVNFIDNLENK